MIYKEIQTATLERISVKNVNKFNIKPINVQGLYSEYNVITEVSDTHSHFNDMLCREVT